MNFSKVNESSLRLLRYLDARSAHNMDLSTQLGCIIFLAEKHKLSVPRALKSYKCRQNTLSAMSGNLIAFANIFGAAIDISQDPSEILSRQSPIQLLNDKNILFDFISKGSQTSAKRTMLDVSAAC